MRVLLVVMDNGSFIHWFPLNIGYLCSGLGDRSVDVSILSCDIHHYDENYLTEYFSKNKFDIIGVGFCAGYYQYRKIIGLSKIVNASQNKSSMYVLGGHGPSPEPEYFLRKTGAAVVVIGEGEETFKDLVDGKRLKDIDGIAYMEDGNFFLNKRRKLIKDVDAIPFPKYDLFPMEYYRLVRVSGCDPTDFIAPVLSGRGCKYKCNFCYRMDKGFRARSTESILEEIALLQRNYNINYINFADELFMSSKDRVHSACEEFVRSGIKFKWNCNGRLNCADAETLNVMKRSGCVRINYGIEAIDNDVLRNMNKCLDVETIVKGIENTLKEEIDIGYNVIFGNIGDNKETIKKGVEFLLKYNTCEYRTIRPVTPYPGTDLYKMAIKNKLIDGVEDFYENKCVNSDLMSVNFTSLSDEEFDDCLVWANSILTENYYNVLKDRTKLVIENLYRGKNKDFRGFRTT